MPGRETHVDGMISTDVPGPSPSPGQSTRGTLLIEALENIGSGVAIWDADLRLVTCNNTYPKLNGIPEGKARPGTRLADLVTAGYPLEDDLRTGEEIEAMVRAVLARDGRIAIDRFLSNGATVSVVYHPLSAGGWVAIYEDVTASRNALRLLKQSEQKLKLQNATLDAALDSMPYGFSIWDNEYRLVLTNQHYPRMYGLKPGDLVEGMELEDVCRALLSTRPPTETTPAELAAYVRDRFGPPDEHAEPRIHEFLLNDRTIKSSVMRLKTFGWAITDEDVTEARARLHALGSSERELRRQNIRFEAAVNNMSQGLCMFDADRRLVICNAEYANIYRLPPDLVQPGTPLLAILDYRAEHGLPPGETREGYIARHVALVENHRPDIEVSETPDGRILSVQFHPMSDGGWVSTHQDVTEQRRNEARIQHLARHDPLTDLPNRLSFRETMEGAEQSIRRGEVLGVLAIDLDHFKAVNDTFGHGLGDSLLRVVGERLRACCRDGDSVARLGGDEFAILTAPLVHAHDAAALADRIVRTIGEPFEIEGREVIIGASVGIAVAPGDGVRSETLLKNADLALYRAKNDGRGAYHFFERGMDAALQERRATEMGLRQALQKNEFRLVFQPLFNLEQNRICALEALLRWYSPERGTIRPQDFVPVAEETGLIAQVGEWVLHEACLAASRWPESVNVAVNLSTAQFRNRNLYSQITSALQTSGLDPRRLELEVTESLLLQESEATLRVLHHIRRLGVRISMDDFGTGYSSLSYLRSFPFDKIKIDRSFVKDLHAASDSRAIVSAVIGLGRSLGMVTTAEGIETEEQLDAVRKEGCTEVQGFLLSPPLPASAVDRLFAETHGMEEWTRTLTQSSGRNRQRWQRVS